MPRFWIRLLRLLLEVLYDHVEAIRSPVLALLLCFCRTSPVQRRCSFAGDMVMWSSDKATPALVFVSVLLQQPVSRYGLQCHRCGSHGFFRHFFYVFVDYIQNHHPKASSIAKWGVDTAFMVTDCHLQYWTDLCVPTDPSFHFGWVSSRGSVYSRHEPPQFVKFRIFVGPEILSIRQSLHDTMHWSTVWSIEDDLEDSRISFIIAQQVSLHLFIGLRWVVRYRQFFWHHQGLPTCSEQQVSLHILNNQRFSKPVRRTHPQLLRGHWADWRKWLCEESFRLFRRHHRNLWTNCPFSFASQRSSFKSTGSTEYGMSNSSQCRELDRIDGEPMEFELKKFPKIHYIADSRPRSRTWWLKLSVNLSNSKDESSSCQCTTTMCGKKKETKNCVLRIPKP